MISVAEAIQIVKDQTQPLSAELVPLHQSIGRVLANDALADSDLPSFDRSQMDGYAVRARETVNAPVSLRIVGESIAGKGWHNVAGEGEAVRIMTGAPVPEGTDSVQQVELTHELKDGTVVELLESVQEGRSIVKKGAEIRKGEVVLVAGTTINAAMVAVLAAFGYGQVSVAQKPLVAALATGSELVSIEQIPGRDQIRDSNNYSIAAYSELAGARTQILPLTTDDTANLKERIAAAAQTADVIVTSGGVSMGVYDFTKTALRELGAELFFERVALRPGKPTVFGRLPDQTLVFGLPGNPVSVSVTFNLFARTALRVMQSARDQELPKETALLARTVKGTADRASYLPAQLTTNDDGQLIAFPLKWGGSSDFVSFSLATALIVVPAGVTSLEADDTVRVVQLPH